MKKTRQTLDNDGGTLGNKETKKRKRKMLRGHVLFQTDPRRTVGHCEGIPQHVYTLSRGIMFRDAFCGRGRANFVKQIFDAIWRKYETIPAPRRQLKRGNPVAAERIAELCTDALVALRSERFNVSQRIESKDHRRNFQ